MKLYGVEKLYILLVIVVSFLVAGITTTSFAITLGHYGMVQDGVDGVEGLNGVRFVTISSDGKNLYAAADIDNAVVVFNRDMTTGALTFVEKQTDGDNGIDGLLGASAVTVSPDDKHVYATGYDDDAIAVFNRNITTGALTFIELQKNAVNGVSGLNGVNYVTISPDGNHLYTAADLDSAVAVFSRNASTGALTFVEVQKDEVAGIDSLQGCLSVTVSPDGKHLYTAARWDDAVTVFSRNETTGALTYIEKQQDDINGVDGIYGAASVIVSPDNNYLYAAGIDEDSVAVFSRNIITGTLTYVGMYQDINNIYGAVYVTVSMDGKHLYAAGQYGFSIAMFSRDETTGMLTFIEVQKDGIAGVDGLYNVTSVAVSPNDEHLYASGKSDNAVAIFSILYTTAELDAERSRWDANDDNKIGLEEAIQALRITSGL